MDKGLARITVTEERLGFGCHASDNCPVARALFKQLPSLKHGCLWLVYPKEIRVLDCINTKVLAVTSNPARLWVEAYDSQTRNSQGYVYRDWGGHPFSFCLDMTPFLEADVFAEAPKP